MSRLRHKDLVDIAAISAAMLFLEMTLVRWVAAEIRIFAYMHNLLLVASFLGIGLGCYRARRRARWTRGLVSLFVLAVIVADPWHFEVGDLITTGFASLPDTVVWGGGFDPSLPTALYLAKALGAAALTLAIVLLTILSLEPYGQAFSYLMDAHANPVAAYSANLVGSLIGTWGFFAASALATGPAVWFAIAALLTAPYALDRSSSPFPLRRAVRALVLAAPFGAFFLLPPNSPEVGTVWSPYQKLQFSPIDLEPAPGAPNAPRQRAGFMVNVNNIGYQAALDLSDAFRASRPDMYDPSVQSHYDFPYRVLPPVDRILVVGAGTGNDVAAALRHGAKHVDAIEIDPEIFAIGRRLHPEKPYASERVHSEIADARSFFKRAKPQSYDVVWFGLLDSHTTGSGLTTLRLDHYVYTRESFEDASRLLRPGGAIVCIFETQRPWVGNRIFAALRTTFRIEPISLRVPGSGLSGWGGELFFAGSGPALAAVRAAIDRDVTLSTFVANHATKHPNESTFTEDDWPYLYLQDRQIPSAYALVTLAIVFLISIFRKHVTGGRPVAWPFFWLGAGFLLLEVLGVSRAALLFGATWSVTAIVVSGVLFMALFANLWVAVRGPSRALGTPLAGLLACGALLLLVPVSWFSNLAPATRVVAVGTFLAAPVFFSGLIFTRLYREAPRKDIALGSNLLGAVAGGLAEQGSFVFGLRALVGVALSFYVIAVLIAAPKIRRVLSGSPS